MTEYPQYRKYVGVETYYKINSADQFVEIKRVGNSFVQTNVDAIQYPEKLRIQDMIQCLEGRWEIINAEQYEAISNQLAHRD